MGLEGPEQRLTSTEVSLLHQSTMPRVQGNAAPDGWQKCKQSVPGLVFTAGCAGQPGELSSGYFRVAEE